MKRLIAALILFVFLAGCQSSTAYGPCVGVTDDKQPDLVYKLSKRNVVLGVIFFETAIVPIWILLWELQCPVGKKGQTA